VKCELKTRIGPPVEQMKLRTEKLNLLRGKRGIPGGTRAEVAKNVEGVVPDPLESFWGEGETEKNRVLNQGSNS